MEQHDKELFLKLQEDVAKAFDEYEDAIYAYDKSNHDQRLKEIMDKKNRAYQLAFDHFQSWFPMHTI